MPVEAVFPTRVTGDAAKLINAQQKRISVAIDLNVADQLAMS